MATQILCESGIYMIRNTVTGKSYVGSAINFSRRFKSHRSSLRLGKHHSQKMQRSWAKHGELAFEFIVLERIQDASNLIKHEQLWIDRLDSYNSGYNAAPTAGSSFGRKASPETKEKMSKARQNMSAETRAKMSASRIGKKMTDNAREALRVANTGKKLSDEQKKKISEFRKSFTGWKHSEETKKKIGRSGEDNCMFGRPVSEDTKKLISISLLGNQRAKGFKHSAETREKGRASSTGRSHSDESKQKISIANKGRVFSEQTRKKMSESAKARRAKVASTHCE